jgi:hypothetical protein
MNDAPPGNNVSSKFLRGNAEFGCPQPGRMRKAGGLVGKPGRPFRAQATVNVNSLSDCNVSDGREEKQFVARVSWESGGAARVASNGRAKCLYDFRCMSYCRQTAVRPPRRVLRIPMSNKLTSVSSRANPIESVGELFDTLSALPLLIHCLECGSKLLHVDATFLSAAGTVWNLQLPVCPQCERPRFGGDGDRRNSLSPQNKVHDSVLQGSVLRRSVR